MRVKAWGVRLHGAVAILHTVSLRLFVRSSNTVEYGGIFLAVLPAKISSL
jgi:hypothetical protein